MCYNSHADSLPVTECIRQGCRLLSTLAIRDAILAIIGVLRYQKMVMHRAILQRGSALLCEIARHNVVRMRVCNIFART